MKNIIVLSALALISVKGFSQGAPGCPLINAGPDVCGSPCATLTATITDLPKATTSYTVAAIPYVPFSFTGTPILVGTDDIWSNVINLGFNFCYFGNTYNQAVIGANGELSFNTALANVGNGYMITQALPSASNIPANTIAAVFRDIDPSLGGNIYTHTIGSAPCRTLVISWVDIPLFHTNNGCATSKPHSTFQLVLYENSNFIDVYIQNSTTCASWNGGYGIVGIQNANATVAVVPTNRNYPTTWTATNEAWRFSPTGAAVPHTITWTGPSGVVGTGASVNVCPTATSYYTASATYTTCTGNNLTITDDKIVARPAVPSFTLATRFCGGADVTANWTASTNLSNAYWEVVESDASGNPIAGGYSWSKSVIPSPGVFNFGALTCNKNYRIKLTSTNECGSFETSKVTYVACSCSTNDGSTKTKAIDLGNTCFAIANNNTSDPVLSNTYASTINATLMPNGQPSNDIWYKFTVGSPVTEPYVMFKIHTCESVLDTYIHLLDVNSNVIQENDDQDLLAYANRQQLDPTHLSDCYTSPPAPPAINNAHASMVNTATNTQGVLNIKTAVHGNYVRLQRNAVYYIVVEGYSTNKGPFTLMNQEICWLSPVAKANNEDAITGAFALEVYPNPFTNITTLKIDGAEGSAKVEITNVNGAVVYKNETYKTTETITLGENFPTGVYFVRVNTDKESKILKLVKIQ